MNSTACENLDYECATPMPRSAFAQDGPLCASLAEYLYDPANCDPGFWCGCSSTDPALCIPSNDTNSTLWGGHFTTINKTTGEQIVLVGWFGVNASKCPPGYYCPGKEDVGRCVDLCIPSMYCPDPAEMKTCPEGYYCPVATVEPLECEGLELCSSEGQRRFKVSQAAGVIMFILVLSVVYLFLGKFLLNRNARRAKLAKLASKLSVEPDVLESTVQGEDENLKEGQSRMSRRRSTLTPPELTMDIEFERLSLTIPDVGTLITGVTGHLMYGNLTAIMGPSGAGKTTFLNIMSGKIDRTGGVLKVNGVKSELSNFREVIGFVPQDDIMLTELSVEEIVTHSALMRLPMAWSNEKKRARVDEVLESLHIDHIRDSVVGDEHRRGISGGERKRVNIAMEMVAKPSLICLDEPTSGLDSTTALTVVQSLKDLALTGANVIAVLHQPKYEVFQLFDQVLLLGKGGMIAYFGPTNHMSDYFAKLGFPCPPNSNPADFYMDVVSGIIPHSDNPDFEKDDLFEAWMCAEENPDSVSPEDARSQMENIKSLKLQEKSGKNAKNALQKRITNVASHLQGLGKHLYGDLKAGNSARPTPPPYKQTLLLLKRSAIQRLRTPFSTLLNIILMALAGAVLPNLVPDDATLYIGIPDTFGSESGQQAYLRQNVKPADYIPGIITNIYFFLIMVSCLSVNVFGSERAVFFRDTASGQSVFSYWLAKTFETLVWLPVYTSAFVLLGYSSDAWFLQPLRYYWLFIFLALVGFSGVGFVCSLLVGPSSAALLALVFNVIACIMFSGTINAYGDASAGFQNFIACWFIFWSTQGLVSEEYNQYRYAFDVDRLNAETPGKMYDDFGSGQAAVGAGVGLGFDLTSSLSRNAALCMTTAMAWHILALWTLKTKNFKKHR